MLAVYVFALAGWVLFAVTLRALIVVSRQFESAQGLLRESGTIRYSVTAKGE